jgi:hypothetical protein
VGHALLQQLLRRYISGSWVPTAVAVDGSCLATAVAAGHMRWVMGAYSNCCDKKKLIMLQTIQNP